MCGICGIVHTDRQVDREVVIRMIRSMIHRGPDGQGTYLQGRVGLGACRLAIIDLEGGQQPIANEDGSKWIVFNGEIYNYRELREYLLRKGHEFSTKSDTEVILHLYEEFGSECVKLLNGIFAFAIWDEISGELFLARDRMGIKPLYYKVSPHRLLFGSELKVLLADPTTDREIDLAALNDYLSYEYVPSPRTILRGICRLEPGHWLRWNDTGAHIERYWTASLARSESRPPVKWRDYGTALREVLRDAIRQELVSDVPVGVLLSGGIDSSSIAAFMVQEYPGRVQSFSVAFEEPSFDESRYSRMVAQHLGTEHHELVVSSDMAARLVPDIASVMDEPLGDGSLVPTLMLSRFAREHVKVVLGGDGGDELFAGYPTLAAHRLIEYYERLVPWRIRAQMVPTLLNLMPVSFNNLSYDFRIRRFLSGRGVPLEGRHHRWLGSFLDEEKADLLEDWVKPVLFESYAEAYRHSRECDAKLPINRILYDDMKLYMEGDILFKVDRASMAASLEVRVPFLNRSVVEFAVSLPLELKLKRLTGKYLLRRIMADRLPRTIVTRPKKGFGMPIAHWLTSTLRELAQDMLSAARLKRQGLFKPAYVQRLLQDHLTHRCDNRKLLWTLLMFQLWHQRYIEAVD